VAAVLIALVLIRVSLRLIQRSHDFLVGAWTGAAGGPRSHDVAGFTQPFRPADEEQVRAFLLAYPGVTGIRQLLVTFLGQAGYGWSPGLTSAMACAVIRSGHWSATSSRA
jgi:hypothetical protein